MSEKKTKNEKLMKQYTIDFWFKKLEESVKPPKTADKIPDLYISTTEKLKFCSICEDVTLWRLHPITVKGKTKYLWRCTQCKEKKLVVKKEIMELMPYVGTKRISGMCEQCGNFGELVWQDGYYVCDNCREIVARSSERF